MDIGFGEKFSGFAAFFAGNGYDGHLAVVGGLDGAQDVDGVSAGRDGDQYIAGTPQCGNLEFEYGCEPVVVAQAGMDGVVGVLDIAGTRQAFAFEMSPQIDQNIR